MAEVKKPESRATRPANYGTLLAGHDTRLGIAAVKAAAAASPRGRTHPPAQHTVRPRATPIRH